MFGLECSLTGDGIEVPGNQTIKTPKGIVRTYHDHRIAMTAMILATVKGATIRHQICARCLTFCSMKGYLRFGIQPCLPKCSSMLWSDIRIGSCATVNTSPWVWNSSHVLE